ncbi:sirohydrochlorin cobaltochelatase [Candidatus Methylacidiphilum infernorum]|uniref:Sirohydrochlorin cobaltochelatase n=1 Tax=Candidatus Methylacidiphilum infernorum TaxID=511746 RepID=A0ABX7PTJ3_9BACT|nr:CbiX/SirB N-terminal domain-containing protein [Candidatus Methylacidiphilum infernorum]QSR86217.1 sirohydrochlorin cobaltochelatase [Candidatus Methylacidiphilum infernorum]
MTASFHRSEWAKSVLVLAGHGSLYNPDAALPVYINAEKIRRKKIFKEVYETFWKEEPSFHQTLLSIQSPFIYVVPFFLSHGFFTARVIPTEMEIEGSLSRKGDKRVGYCKAIGENPKVAEIIIQAVYQSIQDKADDIIKDGALLLVSHGTRKNAHSKETVYKHLDWIKKRNLFGECHVFFLEEEPRVSGWKEHVKSKFVFCVPFFISEGDHSYVDVPKLMGVTVKKGLPAAYSPQKIDGFYLWYTKSVGTLEGMDQIVLEQVAQFDEYFGVLAGLAC